MSQASPAIVAERGAQRMPRWALLLLCLVYVVPGMVGRDPWRGPDLNAFGFMASIAQGHAAWTQPAIAGIPAEGGLLPYWVGAVAIKVLPFLDPAMAARLPFALALAATLALVWYSTFHLARTGAAQPVAFAFGGEAPAIDYARALADGALLALIASLGLLQMGHETTPELLQLLGAAMLLYGLSTAPYKPVLSPLASTLALVVLASSGAPVAAVLMGLGGSLLCWRSQYPAAKRQVMPLLVATALAATMASFTHGWAWRVTANLNLAYPSHVLSLLAWFCWPTWPLALWTLWRWRGYSMRRHVSVPLMCAIIGIGISMGMNASDRALLLALPAMAVLAAFALPTLQRSVSAAIDWFSVFFFSACALFVWLYYSSMQLGWPAQPLINLQRLANGFMPSFHPLALLFAGLGSLAWLYLVRWRTARHQHALWKSLVLPAGGVALCWLLAMSLGLPFADYARSNTAWTQRIRQQLPAEVDCLAAVRQPLHLLASLEFQAHLKVHAVNSLASGSDCTWAIQSGLKHQKPVDINGWTVRAFIQRPTERDAQGLYLLQRQPKPGL